MPDISGLFIKDSFQYVVQADVTTKKFYRLDGTPLVNPIFTSGLTVQGSFIADTVSATTYYNVPSDNFSRVLNVCENDLIGTGTIEEKLLNYLLLIDYKKQKYDGEVEIIVDQCGPAEMVLDITIYAGSVIVVFNFSTNRVITQDISLPVELILDLNDGSSRTIQTNITIESGKVLGSSITTITELNYDDLSRTYNITLGQLSLDYSANIQTDLSFGGYISGLGNDWENGIGLNLLD